MESGEAEGLIRASFSDGFPDDVQQMVSIDRLFQRGDSIFDRTMRYMKPAAYHRNEAIGGLSSIQQLTSFAVGHDVQDALAVHMAPQAVDEPLALVWRQTGRFRDIEEQFSLTLSAIDVLSSWAGAP